MEQILTPLLAYGPQGLIIGALLLVCKRLFDLYVDTQEKRITESRETVKAHEATADALETLTMLVKERLKG